MPVVQEKMANSIPAEQPKKTKHLITNIKERKRVLISLLLTLVGITAFVVLTPVITNNIPVDSRAFKGFYKNFGSLSQVGFFFTVAIFPIYFLLKKNILPIKHLLKTVAQWVRQWHVPVAIVSTGLVAIHGYFAILKGGDLLKPSYISGYLATLFLVFLLFSGLFKFKKRNTKSHLKLGISFTLIFVIHTFLR